MTIEFTNEQDLHFDFDFSELAAQVAEAVLDQEVCPYEAQISLVLTDDEEIQRVNRQFRGIDRPTDVLSFPMISFPHPAEYAILEEDERFFHPDSGELLLGDIMISIPRAVQQAEEYGHSVRREYAFLVAHSMLHLLGYDHVTEAEREQMEAKQEQVLRQLQIGRDQ